MATPVRFGILSFAHYHANFWAEAINQHEDASLVGVWDDDVDRGKKAADKYGTRFYERLSELLRECDAVGVTSETSKHVELVVEAARAGVHVLTEKPMACNLDEGLRMNKAIEENGVLFMQNFPKRYDPVNHALYRLVQEGTLGDIALVRIRHGNDHLLSLGEKATKEWFGIPELSGGGALIDEGSHALDFFVWFFGLPAKAFAQISHSALGLPVEDTAVATLTYPNGMLAELATSNTFTAGESSVELYGNKGTALVSGVDLASRDFAQTPFLKYYIYGEERGTWRKSEIVPEFVRGQFHHQGPVRFLKCLTTKTETPVVSLDESLMSMAILSACYRSAETGQAEDVPAMYSRAR